MTTATVDIELREKLERFKAAMLQTVPGITEEGAEKASKAWEKNYYTKQAKAISGLETDFEKAQKAQAAAAEKAAKEAAKAAEHHTKAWETTGKKLASLAGGEVKELTEAVMELVPTASSANASLGALVGVGVGIAAVAVAAVAVVEVTSQIAESANEAEERLVEAGLAAEIPASARAALAEYRDETKRLSQQVDLLTVSLGEGAVRAVTAFSQAATGAIATGHEFVDWIGEAIDVLGSAEGVGGGDNVIAGLVQAKDQTMAWNTALMSLGLSIPIGMMWDYAVASAAAGEAAEKGAKGASEAAINYMLAQAEVDDDIRQGQRKLAEDVLKKRKELLEKEANEDVRAGESEKKRQTALSKELGKIKQKADEEDAARSRAASLAEIEATEARVKSIVQAHTAAVVAGTIAQWQAVGDAAALSFEEVGAIIEERIAIATAGIGQAKANTMQALEGIGNVASAAQALAEFQAEKGGEGAKQAYAIAKSLALAQIAISTAAAVMQYAGSGPAAPFLIAGVTALGASQAAIVAATPPPEFPGGGVVPASVLRSGSSTPDHGLVGMQPGEGAVSHRGMAAIGEDGLRAINQGMGGGSPIVVQNVYKHRVFDSFVQDNLKRGGPLSKALTKQRKPGHSRRA